MDAKFMGTLSLLVIGNFIFVNSPLYMYGFVTQKKKKKTKRGCQVSIMFSTGRQLDFFKRKPFLR